MKSVQSQKKGYVIICEEVWFYIWPEMFGNGTSRNQRGQIEQNYEWKNKPQ